MACLKLCLKLVWWSNYETSQSGSPMTDVSNLRYANAYLMLILFASDELTATKNNNWTKLWTMRKFNFIKIEYYYLLYILIVS